MSSQRRDNQLPPDDLASPTPIEARALCIAIGNMVGTPSEGPLVSLLRKISPHSETLARLDKISREHLAESGTS